MIKLKVGFRLLPVALAGLSRIIHLINIEMVEDLVILLKGLVQPSNNTLPPDLKLSCIHCALLSLSGPGQELGIDDEFFIVQLRSTIVELPLNYPHWDTVYHCIEICFMKKRDVRNVLILSFVSLLLHLSPLIPSPTQSITALTLAHCILLKYPRTREQMNFLTIPPRQLTHSLSGKGTAVRNDIDSSSGGMVPSYISPQADDEVGDLAMMALKRESKQHHGVSSGLQPGLIGADGDGGDWSDGSWVTPLLSHHISDRYRNGILKPLNSRNIMPVPLRIMEVSPEKELQFFVSELEKIFRQLPEKRVIPTAASRDKHNEGGKASVSKKNQKQQKQKQKSGGEKKHPPQQHKGKPNKKNGRKG